MDRVEIAFAIGLGVWSIGFGIAYVIRRSLHRIPRIQAAMMGAVVEWLFLLLGGVVSFEILGWLKIPAIAIAIGSACLTATALSLVQSYIPAIQFALDPPFDLGDTVTFTIGVNVIARGTVIGLGLHGVMLDLGNGTVRRIPALQASQSMIDTPQKRRDPTSVTVIP